MATGPENQDSGHDQLGRVAALFAEHGVEFVVIGGWSIDRAFPEIGYLTDDIDLVVASADENYERIAAALNDLEVRADHRGIPRKDPADVDAGKLKAREHWRFHTDGGIVDIMSSVGIISGYDVVAGTARPVRASADSDAEVQIADPKIVYVSKAVAGRAKDRTVLDALLNAIEAADGPAGVEAVELMEAAARGALEEGTLEAVERLDAVIKAASASVPNPSRLDFGTGADAGSSPAAMADPCPPLPQPAALAAQSGTPKPPGLFARIVAMFRRSPPADSSLCGHRIGVRRWCRNPRPAALGGRCAAGHRRAA